MKLFPAEPDARNFHNWEVFNHESYLQGTEATRREMRRESARAAYEYENQPGDSWLEKYFFPPITAPELRGASLLDLGCFTGGRLIAWTENYRLANAHGIDINPIFAEAASEFALERGVQAHFRTGFGELLPYENNTFDFIVSTDVFEHVRDLQKVLSECHRTLRPGGRLLCVFPQRYQPLDSHLGFATSLHGLHWLFSGPVLARAYYETIHERGPGAAWYAPQSPHLQQWERAPHLNGTTVAAFKRMLRNEAWQVEWNKRPILTDGRRSKQPIFRALSRAFVIPSRLPILEEMFLGRICCVLKKTLS